MRAYTLNELFRFTRHELFELHGEIVRELNAMPETAPDRGTAYGNLQSIRHALARTRFEP